MMNLGLGYHDVRSKLIINHTQLSHHLGNNVHRYSDEVIKINPY